MKIESFAGEDGEVVETTNAAVSEDPTEPDDRSCVFFTRFYPIPQSRRPPPPPIPIPQGSSIRRIVGVPEMSQVTRPRFRNGNSVSRKHRISVQHRCRGPVLMRAGKNLRIPPGISGRNRKTALG